MRQMDFEKGDWKEMCDEVEKTEEEEIHYSGINQIAGGEP